MRLVALVSSCLFALSYYALIEAPLSLFFTMRNATCPLHCLEGGETRGRVSLPHVRAGTWREPCGDLAETRLATQGGPGGGLAETWRISCHMSKSTRLLSLFFGYSYREYVCTNVPISMLCCSLAYANN